MVKRATEMDSDRNKPTQVEIHVQVRMPPDVFRRLQDDFVRDFASLLKVDPSEIKILDVHLATPEECACDVHPEEADEYQPLRWKDPPPNLPVRLAREEQLARIRALKTEWDQSEDAPRVSEETLVQVVAVYSAYVDQLLLSHKDADPVLVLDRSKHPPVFYFQDEPATFPAANAEIIKFFFVGRVSDRKAEQFCNALVASLERHRDVLPNINVEVDGENLIMRSSREDPLKGLTKTSSAP